jgi:hypothetical protein
MWHSWSYKENNTKCYDMATQNSGWFVITIAQNIVLSLVPIPCKKIIILAASHVVDNNFIHNTTGRTKVVDNNFIHNTTGHTNVRANKKCKYAIE